MPDPQEAVLAERRRCTRNAWVCAVVFGLLAVGLVALLAIPAQRGFLEGDVPSHDATVVAVRPSATDTCRGAVERSWDVTLRWTEGGAARTGVSRRCGERAPVAAGSVHRAWVRSDGVVTLDSPAKARWAMGFLLAFDLLLGAACTAAWLWRKPPLPARAG